MRLLTIDRPRTRICKCWCNRQRTKSFGKRGRESDGLKRDVPVRKNPYKGINLNKKHYFCNEFGTSYIRTEYLEALCLLLVREKPRKLNSRK